jgi:hypothetical protein
VAGDWGVEWVSETGGVSKIEALLVPLRPSCPTSSLSPLAEREREREREEVVRHLLE